MSDSLRPHGLYVAHQTPLSMGFCRQEYWNGLSFPPPGNLPNPGIEPASPALQVGLKWTSSQHSYFQSFKMVMFFGVKRKYILSLDLLPVMLRILFVLVNLQRIHHIQQSHPSFHTLAFKYVKLEVYLWDLSFPGL